MALSIYKAIRGLGTVEFYKKYGINFAAYMQPIY